METGQVPALQTDCRLPVARIFNGFNSLVDIEEIVCPLSRLVRTDQIRNSLAISEPERSEPKRVQREEN